MLSAISNFLFPNNCVVCHTILSDSKDFICQKCKINLPYTHWKLDNDNELFKKIKKFVSIESATSLLFYRKSSGSKELLHALKYKGRQEIGAQFANELIHLAHLKEKAIDGICYIPVHHKKLKQRGYNQNHRFASQLSALLEIPIEKNLLQRNIHQKSQTTLHRGERFKNLDNTYSLNYIPNQLEHILLIDDVCTTGSTLVHCAQLLQKAHIKVSVVTMAFVD